MNTTPEAAAHIYAEDDAAVYQSIFGEDGVFNIGNKFKATILNNNSVRVGDGVLCVGGHIARNKYGTYQDMTIANGTSGKNRNDLIVARFTTTGSGGVDSFSLAVKQGTVGTAAADPAVTRNDLYAAGKLREYPLYRVKIEGLSITKVEQMFQVIPTIPELQGTVERLNSDLATAVNTANKIKSGFRYHSVVYSPNSTDTYKIATLSWLNTQFGTSDTAPSNFSAIVINGDGKAAGVHCDNCTWMNDGLYATFSGKLQTDFRLNIIYMYLPWIGTRII